MPPAPSPLEQPPAARLRLQPFRALRYDESRLDDLWKVTSPTYDLLDEETIGELLAQHAHNVVRLILPRRGDAAGSSYALAGRRLRGWLREGVLRTDPTPGLYVYEYSADAVLVRGLVGCVGLYNPREHVVLPHEDVMAGPVEDRLALMLATRANLEPILLVYDGGGAASDIVEAAAGRPPMQQASAPDGSPHRLWQVSDPHALSAIAADLTAHAALIADGHHRYATYRALRERLAGSRLAAPAQVGLAMLVDQHRYPLRVGAIHRTVAGMSLSSIHSYADLLRLTPQPDAPTALAEQAAGRRVSFVLTDGDVWQTARLVSDRDEEAPSAAAAEIDALHKFLFPRWGVVESRIGYHHDVQAALRAARANSGVAILTRAPSVAEVMAVARAGARMPRKSTSFRPKPRMGLIGRLLDPD